MKTEDRVNKSNIENIRHSLAHLLAAAVLKKIPEAKFGIGPVIEDGFYYDFLLPRPLVPDDLLQLEKLMRDFIKMKLPFTGRRTTFPEAKRIFKNQPFKLELIADLAKNKNKPSIYKTGEIFLDLCRGGHIKNTREINPDAFKLTRIAGAYWRGDEKNQMLTRIYGAAFSTKKELDGYFRNLEEVKKRDHRQLGQQLDLFSVHEEYGPGLIYWHPNGARIRTIMEDFWRKSHFENGYDLIFTPHIGKSILWETSGHLDFYKENMYSPMEIDKDKYYIKPMNCPFHIQIYKNKIRSYRGLPLRWAELGTVYRYEKAGVLHGLLRVRGFTQDDAHIICRPDQMPQEILKVLDFSLFILRSFGFNDFNIYLATKPEKSIGAVKMWDDAVKALKTALVKNKLKYQTDEGGGAFYGPKIDIKIKDALKREWQCTTIQFDFNLPECFDMTYIDANGKPARPYMIHRALMGSLERFFGTMIEHYAGAFPVWLAPIQVKIINVSVKHQKYGQKIHQELVKNEIRSQLSDESLTVSKRIREAELQKIPYIVVIGDKEIKNKTVNIRHRSKGELGELTLTKFLEKIKKEIADKK